MVRSDRRRSSFHSLGRQLPFNPTGRTKVLQRTNPRPARCCYRDLCFRGSCGCRDHTRQRHERCRLFLPLKLRIERFECAVRSWINLIGQHKRGMRCRGHKRERWPGWISASLRCVQTMPGRADPSRMVVAPLAGAWLEVPRQDLDDDHVSAAARPLLRSTWTAQLGGFRWCRGPTRTAGSPSVEGCRSCVNEHIWKLPAPPCGPMASSLASWE